jgi:hypothetical protein
MTEPRKFIRAEPMSKDKLREMLAQAVRNTAPELNPVAAPTPQLKAKPRASTPTRAAPKLPAKKDSVERHSAKQHAAKKGPAKASPKKRKARA